MLVYPSDFLNFKRVMGNDRRTIKLKTLLIILAFALPALCQKEIDQRIEHQSAQLEKIKKEINQFKTQLQQAESKEKSIFTKLAETDQSILLTEKMILQLNRELAQKEREIKNLEQSIKTLESNLTDLKDKFAKRLVYLYKNGQYSDLELLLTARSLNEGIYRYKYLRILADIDRSMSRSLNQNINKISVKKALLTKEVKLKEQLLNEKKSYQQDLAQQKQLRQKQLNEARRNKENIAQQLREKEKAAAAISKMIASLEKEREKRRLELERQRALVGIAETNPFLARRGKLIWPVEGEVISAFGVQRHPVLKTITENSGIDIKTKRGAPILAIMDGVVTTVTYIRGFGNTVIIDHGSGFYTVYSHLENIRVAEQEYIKAQSIIAEAGESGSLNGPLLHFEIWRNKTKLNPEEWLTKKS